MIKTKRGQEVFGMSYGVIFSIILIIAIIGIGFFVIQHFLELSQCTEIGNFYKSVQEKVDECWNSGICKDDLKEFEYKLPSKIKNVCFGSIDLPANSVDSPIKIKIEDYAFETSENLFLYPPEAACDGNLYSLDLKHSLIGGFFCVSTSDLEKIKLNKEVNDSVVRIVRKL
ncbi:MAG: hypothetical protein AABY05_02360 [Nanoarchaeota archaeon]